MGCPSDNAHISLSEASRFDCPHYVRFFRQLAKMAMNLAIAVLVDYTW